MRTKVSFQTTYRTNWTKAFPVMVYPILFTGAEARSYVEAAIYVGSKEPIPRTEVRGVHPADSTSYEISSNKGLCSCGFAVDFLFHLLRLQ